MSLRFSNSVLSTKRKALIFFLFRLINSLFFCSLGIKHQTTRNHIPRNTEVGLLGYGYEHSHKVIWFLRILFLSTIAEFGYFPPPHHLEHPGKPSSQQLQTLLCGGHFFLLLSRKPKKSRPFYCYNLIMEYFPRAGRYLYVHGVRLYLFLLIHCHDCDRMIRASRYFLKF